MKNQRCYLGKLILAVALMLFLFAGCSKENSDWKAAKSTSTEEAYNSFVSKYPKGKHAGDALEAAENLAWNDAAKVNAEEAYNKFIAKYPNGKHAGDAAVALEKLNWEAAGKSDNADLIESFIKAHPKSIYLADAQKMFEKLTSVPLTKEYKESCLNWVKEFLYKGKSEAEVYTGVKKRHMHYAYAGFLEMFPKTAHRAEIENLMQGFRLYPYQEKNPIFTYAYLKEKLNYDGLDSVYRWDNGFCGFFGSNGSFMILDTSVDGPDSNVTFQKRLGWDYIGPCVCIGNLQLYKGTITPMNNNQIKVEAEGIYPATKR
jgi:hypothetical protein